MFGKISLTIQDWLKTKFIIEKMNNPIGYVLLILVGLSYAALLSKVGLTLGGIAFVGVVGIPAVFVAMFNPQIGLAMMLFLGFMVHLISKYTSAPVGTSMDALLMVLLFGMLVKQARSERKGFAKSPISTWVLIWVAYNLIQGINPWAESFMAWIYTVRTMALMILVYFVACFSFDSLKKIKWMLWYIIGLLMMSTLYGMKQEFIGFSAAEEAWIYSDALRLQLLFQWTRMRIFSVLNDPATFGVMMAFGSAQCFAMAMGPRAMWQKIMLFLFVGLMLMTMAFTGTRTAYALVPVAIAMYVALTLKKEIIIAGIFAFAIGVVLVIMPTSNPIIFRIQSAFKVTEDESMQVRFENQKLIQPFIHRHPIGAGMGSTGVWGKRFTPDSWLASFPHDSGYVRIAVEQGWIGLILYMSLLFVALRTCTYYYVRVRDPIIKNLYLSLYLPLILLATASYPQEIIVHLPTSLVFYIYLAAIVKLKDFDPNFQKEESEVMVSRERLN